MIHADGTLVVDWILYQVHNSCLLHKICLFIRNDINEWEFLSHYPKQSLYRFVHLFSSDNINATIPDELTFLWKMGKESLERINENPPFPWAWNRHRQILVIKSLDQNNYWCFVCVCFDREGHCRIIQLKPPMPDHPLQINFSQPLSLLIFL